MNRRTYLATTALTVAGLAGCASMDSGDSKLGGQPTKTVSEKQQGGQTIAFGETLELPQATVMLAEPRTTNTYTWSEEGEKRVAKAGEGKQWVVVRTRAENTADRTVRLPLTANFKGAVGDRLFHPGRNKSVAEKYIGGKVDAGGVREGDVMYLTPADVSASDVRVLYEEERPSGKQHVWWE